MPNNPEIYLDYAASTPVDPTVLKAMLPYFSEEFANPSSKHAAGKRAKAALEQARAKVAKILEIDPEEIIFTSSGTASLNAAILGAARANDRNVIMTSPIEHNAVLRPAEALQKEGKSHRVFDLDNHGRVLPEEIPGDTAIVSVMLANNEVGTIQDIAIFSKNTHDAGALMHTDASQAAPTVRIKPRELGVDLLSLDGQKIYGPKGVGVLYVKKGTELAPYYWGSNQEHNLAPGTENLAAIVGFAAALELVQASVEAESVRINALRETLESAILAEFPDAVIVGTGAKRAPHITAIAFSGMERDVIQAYLSQKSVYLSTGAACDPTGTAGISHVLEAMHIDANTAKGALRISYGRPTTEQQITQAIVKIRDVIRLLKR